MFADGEKQAPAVAESAWKGGSQEAAVGQQPENGDVHHRCMPEMWEVTFDHSGPHHTLDDEEGDQWADGHAEAHVADYIQCKVWYVSPGHEDRERSQVGALTLRALETAVFDGASYVWPIVMCGVPENAEHFFPAHLRVGKVQFDVQIRISVVLQCSWDDQASVHRVAKVVFQFIR